MKGLILSGGKGSRLAPITDSYPKQLIPILGKPVLLHCLDYLVEAGIKEAGIILSPETGALIEKELSKHNLGIKVQYIYQDKPLGLAHAVSIAENYLAEEDFIMLLGDNLFDESLLKLREMYEARRVDTLVLLKEVDKPYNFGVAQFDSSGKINKIVEKPKDFISNFAIAGVYFFNKKIFESIKKIKSSARGELEITDAIAKQVESDFVHASILDSYWFDTGTREGLLDANKKIMLKKRGGFEDNSLSFVNSLQIGDVHIGEGSIITNTQMMGPIYIGKNCKIENSIIGPFTSISDNCSINSSELQEAIIMEDVSINDSQIFSSLISRDSEIKADVGEIINKIVSYPKELV